MRAASPPAVRATLSAARARRLKAVLDPFLDSFDRTARIGFDPVEAPRRYADPADQEVAGLLASGLAYGRADLFRPKLFGVLGVMGDSPAAFVRGFEPARDGRLLEPFAYRFHLPSDLGALVAGMGAAIRRHGSLGAALAFQLERHDRALRPALSAFSRALREEGRAIAAPYLGAPRALDHLLPDPAKGGACKRLLLYLRWMVREDEVDLGTWKGLIAPSLLVNPVDTHVMRIARLLGLTRRRDLSWRTAEEITAALRLLDPDDPVRYDFALCHLGMSGACPTRRRKDLCLACPLRSECVAGRRVTA
ncbi:MAG TPA: TIGR02757 family protein [Vulgatibacter sp.]|nr:TIGR02757 family protein [Vulgatibacter sp.]